MTLLYGGGLYGTGPYTPAVYDWQFTIGALIMGPDTSYVVAAVTGLFGTPDIRNGDTPKPADDGGFYGLDFLAARSGALTVVINEDTPADAYSALDTLLAEWQLVTTDTTATKPLTVKRPGRDAERWNGRPRRVSIDDTNIGGGVIVATLEYVVADPRLYSDVVSTLTTGLESPGGGRSYPLTFPSVFGGAIGDGGVVQVVNSGNRAASPLVTFYGPCNSPAVWNDTTGEKLQSTLSLASGDVLVVNFDQALVTFNGAQRWSLTSDSVWWALAPGTTQVRFTAASTTGAPSMSIAWRSARIG